MAGMLACRICLAVDGVKLYNLYQYKLVVPYEVITGTRIIEDGLPQYACSFCAVLLQKTITFKEKCCVTQNLLKLTFGPERELTKENLRFLNNPYNLAYTCNSDLPTFYMEHVEVQVKMEASESDDDKKFEDIVMDIKTKKGKVKRPKPEILEDLDLKLEDLPDLSDNDMEPIESVDLTNIDVIVLTKQEQIDEIEARKSSTNYTNSFYKCDLCYKGFISESTLKNHMVRHDVKRGAHECDICRSRWTDARTLKSHIVTSHERKYVCKLCHHISRSSYRAKEHRNWHDGYKFTCNICGATFGKSTSHLTHIRLHHPSNHCCEICGESFIGEYGLRMHKKRAHRDVEDTNPTLPQCDHCEIKFRSVDALEKHLKYKSGPCDTDSSPCVHCGMNLESQDLLKEHLKEHQNGDSFKCDACQRSFNNERSYSIHYQRVHLGVRLKQCKPLTMKRSTKSVVCEICGQTCMTKASLTYHQRIHTGERPYECTECPKKFSVFQRLQIHLRTHTGECPYQCKHCPKAFKHKAALNRHDRVHTGAKPYSCSHCGKSFSQSNSMKLHVNTVHLKMPAPYRSRRNKN